MPNDVSAAPTPNSEPPLVQDVDQISSIADPVLRNFRITHHYHLLALSFASNAGEGANWCTFAVWASRQAGRTIRGEDMLDAMEQRLRKDPRLINGINRIWRHVFVHAIEHPGSRRSSFLRIMTEGPLAHASDAVARGNRKVYAEIAREFARFLPLCDGEQVSSDALAEFLDGMRPGEPPEGQDDLRLAFTRYTTALQATDPAARAELLLLANLEIGLHEQTRLQPEILEALEVPYHTVIEVGHRLLHALHAGSANWSGMVRTPFALLFGAAARLVGLTLRGAMRHLVTECMMTLSLPTAVIHLGRDLRGEYPPPLREPRNADLLQLLQRYAGEGANGVGAYDWSVLEQRMQLIAQLFRLRHEDPTLLRAPYTPDQVMAFEAGLLPDGDL